MAFTAINDGDLAIAPQLQQVLDALQGVSGAGQPLDFTSLDSDTDMALTIRNLGSGGALQVLSTADAVLLSIDDSGVTLGGTLTFTTINATSLTTTGNISDGGNLTFTGTGKRITGDLINATLANRLLFQGSTVNNNSAVGVIPNGSATTSAYAAFNNSAPGSATGIAGLTATSTEVQVSAGFASGGGLPLALYTANTKQLSISTAGVAAFTTALSIGATPATGGAIRLTNNTVIEARNAANSVDVALAQLTGSNQVLLGDGTSSVNTIILAATDIRLRVVASDILTVSATTAAVTGAITATGNITSSAGNISAASGTITGGALTSTGAVSGASVSATGQIAAGTTLVAGTGITATTGNITSTAGNVSAAAGTVTGGAVTSTGSVSGASVSATGQVAGATVVATTTMTAGTGITATTGNITASAGNVSASGSVTAGTKLYAGNQAIYSFQQPMIDTPVGANSSVTVGSFPMGAFTVVNRSTGEIGTFRSNSISTVTSNGSDAGVQIGGSVPADNSSIVWVSLTTGTLTVRNTWNVSKQLAIMGQGT